MTHPKQNTQVIKQSANVAPKRLNDQFDQARAAFAAAQQHVRENARKYKFVAPSAASRMSMLQPRDRFYFDNKPLGLPRNDSAQCRTVSAIISKMFGASHA